MLRHTLAILNAETHSGASSLVDAAGDPWLLVRAISPRPSVRVAAVGTDGLVAAENRYPRRYTVTGDDPGVPWAMHLTSRQGRHHFLCFDFDAGRYGRDVVQRQAWDLVVLLERIGIHYTVCESGPTGGMHVWVALASPVPHEDLEPLIAAAGRAWSTLDTGPLSRHGLARTPGAPHRAGGSSTIILSDVSTLLEPSTTWPQLRRLARELDERVPAPAPAPAVEHEDLLPGAVTLIDDDGRRYLPGIKGTLGPVATAALTTPVTRQVDASAQLFSVLVGAARARWHYADIHQVLATAPGLEHARTERAGDRRRPRPPWKTQRVLQVQWDRAVAYASTTRSIGTGSTTDLDERATQIAGIVHAAQRHADASAGRWTTAGGHASRNITDRLVLDELHRLALMAMTPEIEAAVRTIAMSLAVGRESVRRALHRLAADGWIAQVSAADGPHGARWSIDRHGVFHTQALQARSQGGPTPATPSPPTPERRSLLAHLESRRTHHCHDVFTHGGLGVVGGYVYARARENPGASVSELAYGCGLDVVTVTEELGRLNRFSLPTSGLDVRDQVAAQLGSTGSLDARNARYRVEQELWEFWRVDMAILTTPVALRPTRLRLLQIPRRPPLAVGAFPRRRRGRADWSAAREVLSSVDAA